MGINNLAKGLGTISQGLNSFSNAVEFKLQVDQRKKEQEFREKEFDLTSKKFKIAEKEAAWHELKSVQSDFTLFEAENKSNANAYLDLPETKSKLAELAPKLGMSEERLAITLKSKQEFFRLRKESRASGLEALGSTIKGDAPALSENLKKLAGLARQASSEEEMESVFKDGKEIVTSAFTFQRQAEKPAPGAISVPEFNEKFKIVPEGTEGAQKITTKDGKTYNALFTPREARVSAQQSQDIRVGVAQLFGIKAAKDVLPVLDPKSPKGQVLPDIDEVTAQAESLIEKGATPQKAMNEAYSKYQEMNSQMDSKLQKLATEGGAPAAEFFKKTLGTSDPEKFKQIPFTKKRLMILQIIGDEK